MPINSVTRCCCTLSQINVTCRSWTGMARKRPAKAASSGLLSGVLSFVSREFDSFVASATGASSSVCLAHRELAILKFTRSNCRGHPRLAKRTMSIVKRRMSRSRTSSTKGGTRAHPLERVAQSRSLSSQPLLLKPVRARATPLLSAPL